MAMHAMIDCDEDETDDVLTFGRSGRSEQNTSPAAKCTVPMVLEETGEDSPSRVSQLILRNRNLDGMTIECAEALSSLQVISLSHNRFTDLSHFQYMAGLVEVNLNFNTLSSLDGLVAPQLARLFLSSNRLADTSLIGLSSRFPHLTTLCLFRNKLLHLKDTIATLRSLPKLREVDLDGNPCSRQDGYRHEVIGSLPRLHELDGDVITTLDRDLADTHYANKCSARAEARTPRPGSASAPSSTVAASIATPPSSSSGSSSSRRGSVESLAGSQEEESAAGTGCDESPKFDWSELPTDEALVGANHQLNQNPLLVTYLAEQVLSEPLDFVGRLRTTAAKLKSGDDQPNGQPVDTPLPGGTGSTNTPAGSGASSSKASARHDGAFDDAVDLGDEEGDINDGEEGLQKDSSQHAPFPVKKRAGPGMNDMSDPFSIIRRLIKLIDLLKEERHTLLSGRGLGRSPATTVGAESCHAKDGVGEGEGTQTVRERDGALDGDGNTDTLALLRREITELRVENANMFALKEENRRLRTEAQTAQANEQSLRQLRAENQELKRTTAELTENLQQLHLQSIQQGPSGLAMERPKTAAEMLDEVDDELDAEVAELLARNESSLKSIRREVKQFQRELATSESSSRQTGRAGDRSREVSEGSGRKKSSSSSSRRSSHKEHRCVPEDSSGRSRMDKDVRRQHANRAGVPASRQASEETPPADSSASKTPPSIQELLRMRRRSTPPETHDDESSTIMHPRQSHRQESARPSSPASRRGPRRRGSGEENLIPGPKSDGRMARIGSGHGHTVQADRLVLHRSEEPERASSTAASRKLRSHGSGEGDKGCEREREQEDGTVPLGHGNTRQSGQGKAKHGRTSARSRKLGGSGGSGSSDKAIMSKSLPQMPGRLTASSDLPGISSNPAAFVSGKLARKQYGDVITVHSPRQAAEILSLLDMSDESNSWQPAAN